VRVFNPITIIRGLINRSIAAFMYGEAMTDVNKGRYAEGLDRFLRLEKMDSSFSENAYFNILVGVSLFQLMKYDDSIKSFDAGYMRFIETGPRRSNVNRVIEGHLRNYYIRVLEMDGQMDKASKILNHLDEMKKANYKWNAKVSNR